MSVEALLLSLRLATIVSALLLLLSLPLAYWLSFTHWRGKFLIESVVALPLVLPPTVLGFYMLIALGPRGALGKVWQTLFGHSLAFTFTGLVIASIIYSLPFAVQPLVASFEALDRRLLDAASILGANKWRTFFRIVVPLAWPGLITAVVLSFAHTLGEFGVVLMVGGNLPGITRTISIDIYDRVQALDYTGAHQTALLLLLISFVVLSVVYGVNRRVGSPWPRR
jgi:molybdate transport system permease protein